MSEIRGHLYDGKTSARQGATLIIEGPMARIARHPQLEAPLAELSISSRVGNIARSVVFPGGEKFQTGDNDALDAALEAAALDRPGRAVHRMERRVGYALIGVALVLVLIWGALAKGVPWLAGRIAYALPVSFSVELSERAIRSAQDTLFQETRLSEARREALRGLLARVTTGLEPFDYGLRFVSGERYLGANAFAFPDGTVLVTDELVALAESDEELLSVLAHETGHVQERHGLRRIVQSSLIAFLIVAVTGDSGSLSSISVGLPALLLELRHSREFEREADDFATAWLRRQGIPLDHFVSILGKLDGQVQPGAEHEGESFDYLSTHPGTAERIRRVLAQAQG